MKRLIPVLIVAVAMITVAAVVKKVSVIDQTKCLKCGTCFKNCKAKAVIKTEKDGKIISCVIDPKKCIGCGTCAKNCPGKAITMVDRATLPASHAAAVDSAGATKIPAKPKKESVKAPDSLKASLPDSTIKK